ncbi:MAG: SURF1 family protein [Methylomonas sp.]
MKLRVLNYEMRFSPAGLLIYGLLLILLCGLGFWQLSRAEQKREFLAQRRQAMENSGSLNLNQLVAVDLSADRYRKIEASGHYDTAHQFLIDNQILDGKPGYFVLTPFYVDGGRRNVLVNRGWVPLGADRSHSPDIEIRGRVEKINGRINNFPSVGVKLKGAEIPTENWPALVQVVDSKILAAKLAYDLYDFQIELNADEPEGYKRQWRAGAIISPEKHRAYAVQWFGLALALTALFIWISIKK